MDYEKKTASRGSADSIPPSHGSNASVAEELGPDSPLTELYLDYSTELPSLSASKALESAKPADLPAKPSLKEFDDPFGWSAGRKRFLVVLSCVATLFTAYAAGCYEAGIAGMEAEFHVSEEATLVGITVFTAGFAVAPMVLAPFSEINGRKPVFLVTGAGFVACVLACGGTHVFAGLLVARFLGGCMSSTFSTLVSGVVADIYGPAERNTPMALFTAGSLFGTGLGPLVSGFVAQHLGWRWIFWLHGIILGVLMVALVLFFRETRGSVLLSRRARALNAWYRACEAQGFYGVDVAAAPGEPPAPRRVAWKVKADEERASLRVLISGSLYRPFRLLVTEPVVFFFSLWISFAWAILYCTFAILPYTYQQIYGFSIEQSGAAFSSICVGATISTLLSIYQDKLAMRLGKLDSSPEGRLKFACIESALLPIGLFWFGWTARASIPWIVPTLAVSCATMGIFSIYLAVFNYLADTYHRYASSAIAAQSFCRNLLGGCFPLFTVQMFKRMTYGGAGSFLGGVGLLLTAVPWVLVLYGPEIRRRSKVASEIMD